jgi:hypothetical protein
VIERVNRRHGKRKIASWVKKRATLVWWGSPCSVVTKIVASGYLLARKRLSRAQDGVFGLVLRGWNVM